MAAAQSNSASILIVDDDIGTRESLEEILEDDYDVICVDSGYAALEKLNRENFDLVLLDVTMPGMDGIETLKKIKTQDKSIDVIMVSATDRAREATRSLQDDTVRLVEAMESGRVVEGPDGVRYRALRLLEG